MGFSSESIQIQTVTPQQADEFLRSNFINNRPIRKQWVAYLAREMREGRFMQTAEIHIMYRNGEPTLVNGQHTCLAIKQYGKPVRVTVRKTITTEAGQIAMVYAFGHDTHLRRTWSDQMGAYDLTGTTGLDRKSLDKLSGAVRFIKGGFIPNNAKWTRPRGDRNLANDGLPSPTELLDAVSSWAPEYKLFERAIQPCDKKTANRIRNRSSLSIALITFRYQLDKALEFWRTVARPETIAWDDPRATARRYIVDADMTDKKSAPKMARQVARCWNAFYAGNSLQFAQVPDVTAKILIAGTPFTGRQSGDFLPEFTQEAYPSRSKTV